MDQALKDAIFRAVKQEALCRTFNMELVDLDDGYSLVEMTHDPAAMDNLFKRIHGGVIFALIDEAFETVCQTCGGLTLALNVNVTYLSSPEPGARLRAEAKEISQSKKTASYDIKVTDQDGRLIASCQALAFRTGKPLPFINGN